MAPPRLQPLDASFRRAHPGLPEWPGARAFVVAEPGVFRGQNYHQGEVLVCHGVARGGDVTILIAAGHGRPRLGTVVGRQLFGDVGEPCHPARWQPCGRLTAVYGRAGAEAWEARLEGSGARIALASPSPAPAVAQLRLFAA